MERVAVGEYESLFDAEKAAFEIWRSIEDKHSFFAMNSMFSLLFFLHPIRISSGLNGNNVQEVYAKTILDDGKGGNYLESFNSLFNSVFQTSFDFEAINGYRIKTINGIDAITYLKDFADTNWYHSRDKSTNFNEMLRDVGGFTDNTWYMRYNMISSIPEPVDYVFVNSDETDTVSMTLDFISCFSNQMGGCLEITNSNALELYVSQYQRRSIIEEKEINALKLNEINERRKTNNLVQLIFLSSDSKIQLFQVSGFDGIAFLQITSFSHTNYTQINEDYLKIIEYLENFDKLVIDLRSNGGGSIVLASSFAKALIKKTLPPLFDLLQPMITTEAFLEQTKPGGTCEAYGDYLILYDVPVKFTEEDGSISNFAPYIRFSEKTFEGFIDFEESSNFDGFEPENIAIVLDGSCGSACGMFTKTFMAMKAAKTYLFGGFADQTEMDVSSFDGASVYGVVIGKRPFYFSWGALFPLTRDAMYDKLETDFTKFVLNLTLQISEFSNGKNLKDQELLHFFQQHQKLIIVIIGISK